MSSAVSHGGVHCAVDTRPSPLPLQMEGHLEEIEKQMGQLALAVKAARESDRLRESARARQDREVKELAVLVEQMHVVQRGRAKVVRDLHNSVVNLRWRLWTVDERLERARAARASGAWPLYSAAVLAEVEAEVEAQVEAQVEVEGDWVEATAPQALQAKVAELETSAAVMKQQLLAAEGRCAAAEGRCAAAHAEVVAGAAARQVILAESVRLLAALREVETELARTLPERSLSLQKEIIAADRALRDELFTKKLEKPLMIIPPDMAPEMAPCGPMEEGAIKTIVNGLYTWDQSRAPQLLGTSVDERLEHRLHVFPGPMSDMRRNAAGELWLEPCSQGGAKANSSDSSFSGFGNTEDARTGRLNPYGTHNFSEHRGAMELWVSHSDGNDGLVHSAIRHVATGRAVLPPIVALIFLSQSHEEWSSFTRGVGMKQNHLVSQKAVKLKDAQGGTAKGVLVVEVTMVGPTAGSVQAVTEDMLGAPISTEQQQVVVAARAAARELARAAARDVVAAAWQSARDVAAAAAGVAVVPAASVVAANATVKRHGDWFAGTNKQWCSNCEDWFPASTMSQHPINSLEGGGRAGVAARHRKAVQR